MQLSRSLCRDFGHRYDDTLPLVNVTNVSSYLWNDDSVCTKT